MNTFDNANLILLRLLQSFDILHLSFQGFGVVTALLNKDIEAFYLTFYLVYGKFSFYPKVETTISYPNDVDYFCQKWGGMECIETELPRSKLLILEQRYCLSSKIYCEFFLLHYWCRNVIALVIDVYCNKIVVGMYYIGGSIFLWSNQANGE